MGRTAKSRAVSGWNSLSSHPRRGEVADAVGNGQSEDQKFHAQAIERDWFRRLQSRMRQHDEEHEQLDPNTEIHAADERITGKKWKFAAGNVITVAQMQTMKKCRMRPRTQVPAPP